MIIAGLQFSIQISLKIVFMYIYFIKSDELWAKLSIKYKCIGLNFAKINVDLLPSIASQFNIQTNGLLVPLPVCLLFRNGEKTHSYPGFDKNGNFVPVKSYKEKEILKTFELETIYNNCLRHMKN